MTIKCPFCQTPYHIVQVSDPIRCHCGASTSITAAELRGRLHAKGLSGQIRGKGPRLAQITHVRLSQIINPKMNADPVMVQWTRWRAETSLRADQ